MKNRNKNTAHNRDYEAPYLLKISIPEVKLKTKVPFFLVSQIRPYMEEFKRRMTDDYCGFLPYLTIKTTLLEDVSGEGVDWVVDERSTDILYIHN